MIKRFQVRNYRSFNKPIVVDFSRVAGYQFNQDCINNGLLGKVIIYGRNATGKTNLARAFGDITYVIRGKHISNHDLTPILNVDSADNVAEFRYEFIFDNETVVYEYSKNQVDDIVYETVSINGKALFSFDFNNAKFHKLNLNLIEADSLRIDKYLESLQATVQGVVVDEEQNALPFLRYILNNSALPASCPLRKMEDFVAGMRMSSVSSALLSTTSSFSSSFSMYLDLEDNLQKFESFLNQMGVDCKLRIIEGLDGNKALYFDKGSPIPFYKTASSGTIALTSFYSRYIANNREPSFIFLDEFDAFYHYEMSENLVHFFKSEFPNTQIILTTHNTNLMTNYLMRPDCLLILSRDGRLTPLFDATERELREGHNLEKLYVAGEFEEYE